MFFENKFAIIFFIFFSSFFFQSNAQTGIIEGKVFDEINNEPLIGANIVLQDSSNGATSDIDGFFRIEGLKSGVYNLIVAYLGYSKKIVFEVVVTNNLPSKVNIGLAPLPNNLNEIEVKANPFIKPQESPLSLTSIGVNEIQRSPGGNRDISKVIQLLPGVSSGVSFRNDLLVRGGGPNENRFYLDGIEVPSINHFQTQGASGGSNGLINVDFIKNVDFYTGAFPANRGNSLSSVMEITQEEGRTDRVGLRATLGASDVGVTLQGPFSKNDKSTFLVSARYSYLQLLFQALKLPFLPTYTDFQFKTVHKFNQNHDLTFIGIGAVDKFVLNLKENTTEESQFILGNLPYFDQWTYTFGARYRYFREKGTMTFVASRNMLNNGSFKYQNNQNNDPSRLIFDLQSQEAENKFRYEHTARLKNYKIAYGVNYEFANYTTETINQFTTPDGVQRINYNSLVNLHKYGLFTQVSKGFFEEKLNLSLGFRADGNSFNKNMSNPFKQFSPRFSASYNVTKAFTINFNTGLYYQMPAYTTIGYRNNENELQNKQTLKYINNKQVVFGLAYNTSFYTKFAVEGFFKKYSNYPMSITKGISLANLGGFFGTVGDEPVASNSEGRTYGFEMSVQQKLYKGLYSILTYTYFNSAFTDTSGNYAPSSWDSRHVLNLVFGYKFKRNWELGVKAQYNGGNPFTPYNDTLSATIAVWDVNGRGIPDYNRLNTERTSGNFRLDIRVDKKWFFKKWNLDLYLDLVNLTFAKERTQNDLTVVRDVDTQAPLIDPLNPDRYQTKYLNTSAGSVIPTLGVIVEF